MKFTILLVFLFMFLANPITGGKLFPGFNNPEKWMKRAIRKLQRKSSSYGQKIASNTDDISNNAGFISSMVDCDSGYINDPAYGLRCCFEDTNNVGQCLCDGTNGTIDDVTNPGSCCFVNVEHPDNCLCSGTDTDDPSNPGNCCFEDANNLGHCLCNAANYTDDPNKRCFNLDWKADGICDDQNNHGGCDFDGGDCCGKDVDTDLCTLCQCLEEEAPLPNVVGCCFEDTNNPGQCLCTGTDIDDPDNAGSCCVEDPDSPGTCCVDSITCNGQGTCSGGNIAICACDSGFTGDRCNITTCPGSGGEVCSGNGNCLQGPPLVCECQAGFYGHDCGTFCDDTTTCSDQGTCGIDGICQCDAGKTGDDCTEVWRYLMVSQGAACLPSGCLSDDLGKLTEVIDTLDASKTCSPLTDFPKGRRYTPLGGLVDGKIVICGGDGFIRQCYTYQNDTWTQFATLQQSDRSNSGTVVIKGNPDKLWLVGNDPCINSLSTAPKTTDFVYSNGTVEAGPTLDTGKNAQCLVQLSNGEVLMIGGNDCDISEDKYKLVKKYNPQSNTFSDQPKLNFDKFMSGCAVFKSAKHSNREVVYVGGTSSSYEKTAEILDYTVTDQWEQVADIPQWSNGPRAVTSPTGDSILHIDGSKIFELKCDESSCFWETWPQRFTTDFERIVWFQAMYIPKELVTCI